MMFKFEGKRGRESAMWKFGSIYGLVRLGGVLRNYRSSRTVVR